MLPIPAAALHPDRRFALTLSRCADSASGRSLSSAQYAGAFGLPRIGNFPPFLTWPTETLRFVANTQKDHSRSLGVPAATFPFFQCISLARLPYPFFEPWDGYGRCWTLPFVHAEPGLGLPCPPRA